MVFKDKLKRRRDELGITLEDVAKIVGVTRATIQKYENGIISNIPSDKIELLAKALQTTPAYLMGWEDKRRKSPDSYQESESLIEFSIIGSIAAGYNGLAIEEYTDDTVVIPVSMLRGHKPKDYFVLRITGNSMYPQFMDGDKVLVLRCSNVDSGSVAVMLYNGEESTVKRVKYVAGEDWLELIPANPEYMTKRIEGPDLEECHVLGKVVMLLRNID